MQVETYEIEDASSEASAMANDHEALELINKLGLTGQQRIMNPETVTRVPYRVAEKEELIVYRTLNPEHCKLEAYSLDAIPTRVLQVAAHAKELNYFKDLIVYYPKAGRIDDPVLVGVWEGKLDGRTWDSQLYYILARWGKTLLPYEQCRIKAIEVLRRQGKDKYRKAAVELDARKLELETSDDLEALSESKGIFL